MMKLRDVCREDAEMLRTWRNLPEISRYMYTDHFITAKEHEAWFRRALSAPARRYWIINCKGATQRESGHSVPRRLLQ